WKTPAGPIFIEANRRLSQTLKTKGYDVRYVEVNGGRHDPINWRFQLAEGLMFLAGKSQQKGLQSAPIWQNFALWPFWLRNDASVGSAQPRLNRPDLISAEAPSPSMDG